MFFSPFGILGGALSFAGAVLNVAWGATKMVAKATGKAVKGAVKVGRFLYKKGKPLGRKVIKMVKSCSGTVLSSVKPQQKSHIFTKPDPGSDKPPSLKSQAARTIAARTTAIEGKPKPESKEQPTVTPNSGVGEQIKAASASIKRASVFTGKPSTTGPEQTKAAKSTPKTNSVGSKVANGAAKAAVLGATVVAPEVVVAAKAGVKTAKAATKVGKGVVRGAKVLADAIDKSPTPKGGKPSK